MSKKEKVKVVDNVITDKGNIVISVKAAKYIIGLLISINIFVIGIAWGFKTSLDSKIDKLMNNMELDKIELYNKIDNLKEEDIHDNTMKNYSQDADLKVLFDRTNYVYNNTTNYYKNDTIR